MKKADSLLKFQSKFGNGISSCFISANGQLNFMLLGQRTSNTNTVVKTNKREGQLNLDFYFTFYNIKFYV